MTRIEKEIVILNKQGLHARPAAMFVQIAQKYNSEISVQKDGEVVNGKSIMGILMLGAQHQSKISIAVEGPDAEAALKELEEYLKRDE
ncbi:MAG: phosphocarrier protein HPr [Omnitrophica WOR_2 bacterium GWA2_47_8]|nr:MAG: phosphocarrier protein HPr [Omnitrophica WOR_2 bacterium GWA2_47_8]